MHTETNCPAATLGAEIAANYREHEKLDVEFFAERKAGRATGDMDRTHHTFTRALDARLNVVEEELATAQALSATGALAQLAALVASAEDLASYIPEDAKRADDVPAKEAQIEALAQSIRTFLISMGADPAIVQHSLPGTEVTTKPRGLIEGWSKAQGCFRPQFALVPNSQPPQQS